MSVKKKKSAPIVSVPDSQKEPVVPNTGMTDFFDALGKNAVFIALGLLLFLAFIVFNSYLSGANAYFFKDIGSDSYNYTYPYLYHVADYIQKYGTPKWSFSYGMGQSLFPFFLRDPFIIVLLLAGKKSILFGIIYNEVFKITLGGVVFYYYLKTLKLSAYTAIIGSLMFAYCGFTIVGSGWHIFSFESFNLALLLLSFELLFAKRNWYLFPIAIFLMCVSQPFNLYVYGLFLATYAILRLFQEGRLNVKDGGMFFLKMAGFGVLGILLSGPFLLENIFQLLESPRGSGTNSYASVLSAVPMFQTADKVQFGTSIMRFFSSDLLGTGNGFKGWQNALEAPLFYCGIPCLLLMPQLFPFLEKKVRLFFIIFLGVWFLPVIFPYFRYAFWLFTGDYYRAYGILLAVFFLYYALLALDKILQQRKINLIILIVTVATLLMLLNYPFFEDTEAINSPIYTFVSLMVLSYGAILFFAGKKESPAYLRYILLGATVLELAYFSRTSANDREPVTAEEITQKKGYNDYTVEAVNYISKDKSFVRVDKDYASSPAMHYSLNDGFAQDYRGTSGYSPFNQLYFIRYLQLMGISDKSNEQESRWARGLTARPILESENRVKYMLDRSNAMPMWRVIGDSVASFGDVKVFRNKLLLPFGYTYTHYIKESVFDKLSMTQKDFVSLKAFAVRDEDISAVAGLKEFNLLDTIAPNAFNLDIYAQQINELGRDSMVADKVEETKITGKINVSEEKMLYLSVPYDAGWQLKVDGKPTDKRIIFAGMTGVLLPKGQHTIEMAYDLRFFSKGLMMSLIGLLLYGGIWAYTRKMNKQQGAPIQA